MCLFVCQNLLVSGGSLRVHCCVSLVKYVCQPVAAAGGAPVIVVVELVVEFASVGQVLGSPVGVGEVVVEPGSTIEQAHRVVAAERALVVDNLWEAESQPLQTRPVEAGFAGSQSPPPQHRRLGAPSQDPRLTQDTRFDPQTVYNSPAAQQLHVPLAGASGGATRRRPNSSGGSPINPQNVRPIDQLNPYASPWTIKAVVDGKGEMRFWNKPNSQGNLFSCTLKDDSGSIRATAFKVDADRLYAELQVGKTYIITRGTIIPTNKRYDDTGHDHEITFARDTSVQEVESGSFDVEYDFRLIASLGSCAVNATVDVIGVAVAIGDLVVIMSRQTPGREVKKRELTLLDNSNASILVTLWGGQADSFQQVEFGAPRPVVCVRNAKVSVWNGCSLSTASESDVSMNPDLAEAHSLRSWYDVVGREVVPQNMSAGGAGLAGPRGLNTDNRMSFAAALAAGLPQGGERGVVHYNNVATITFLKRDGTVAYPSCPVSKKKLVEVGPNQWSCEGTGNVYAQPTWRYCMSVKVEDSTGFTWVTAFDDAAMMILGVDAKRVMDLKVGSDADVAQRAELAAVFDDALGAQYVFRCVLKEETYQEKTQLKTSVLAVEQMDYVAESKNILAAFYKLYEAGEL